MKRDDWTVSYGGDQLLDAATKKITFHSERLSWWKTKKDELMVDIRANGIEINESIVDQLGKNDPLYANSYRSKPKVSIDQEMSDHLSEAHQKIEEHKMKVKEYGAWEQMLRSHQSFNFDLDNDDWMYFFGK